MRPHSYCKSQDHPSQEWSFFKSPAPLCGAGDFVSVCLR